MGVGKEIMRGSGEGGGEGSRWRGSVIGEGVRVAGSGTNWYDV